MRFLDALLGRTKPKEAQLDALFRISGAAITLEAGAGLRPSQQAAVAFKPASGQEFAGIEAELRELLELNTREAGSQLRQVDDDFGYRWLRLTDPDLEDLVTGTHLVNTSLAERGFGPQLLCSVFGFSGQDGPLHLVYLYKRSTYYPFAPRGDQRRDNELELRVRGLLTGDLPIEADLARWFPLWGLPMDGTSGGEPRRHLN